MGPGAQLGRLTAALLAAVVFAGTASAGCAPDRVSLRGDFGVLTFRVEVADEPAERARGLMEREAMAPMAGMLFVFDESRPVTFWMRNTLIPLDMLFADETGRIVRIHENAVPLDETLIPSGQPVRFVLEINGGLAERFGIAEGAELRHPAIATDTAAWPCD